MTIDDIKETGKEFFNNEIQLLSGEVLAYFGIPCNIQKKDRQIDVLLFEWRGKRILFDHALNRFRDKGTQMGQDTVHGEFFLGHFPMFARIDDGIGGEVR